MKTRTRRLRSPGRQLRSWVAPSVLLLAGCLGVLLAAALPGGQADAATITSLSPTTRTAGGTAFTLTVNGTGFTTGSVVQWNGAARPTTYVSAARVRAAIPAPDIATAGIAQVTVNTPNSGVSNAQPLTINNPVPTNSSLAPTATTAGGQAFTLTVTGTRFVSTSEVRWNGAARPTTYVSATQLRATIAAADIATAGTRSVTVFTPTPGGGTSGARTFTINNPMPTTTGLSPSSAIAGSAGFTLTVTGTNFVPTSVVRWNGAARITTFGSATQLTAAITAADIAAGATRSVTVFNPTPGGGTSSARTFTINNPVPTTTGLSPTSAPAGGPAFTLTVTGTNFVPTSVVRWNGAARITTFGSATQLTAAITATDIATGATRSVTVLNPTPGGATSNVQTFTIVGPNPVPTTTGLSPSSAIAGSAGFTLTVTGTNFISSSVVQWNGAGRTTTYVSATTLTAAIPASDIVMAGTASVTVVTPAPGGGTSSAQTFTIVAPNPVPATTGVSPSSAIAGSAGFTLTVTGTNFISSSVVQWNGAGRTTTYVSATTLTAAIPASDIVMAGTASVTVVTPAPGGGTSSAQTFTILSDTSPPTITGQTPANGATGIPTSTTVTATFSEALNPTTVTTSTVTLKGPGTTPVSAAVGYNTSAFTATLTPTSPLAPGTLYTATIGGGASGVTDVAGNALSGDFIWTFTTTPDATPPTVTTFTLPPTATTLTVPITSFTATDTVGVTGYLVTEVGRRAAGHRPRLDHARPDGLHLHHCGSQDPLCLGEGRGE